VAVEQQIVRLHVAEDHASGMQRLKAERTCNASRPSVH
jgi:hypothetical protein